MSEGQASVRLLPDRVIECRAEGYVTRQVVLAALRDLDVILARDSGQFSFLSDALGVEGFDPGIPIALVRWAAARSNRYVKSAIVANQTSLIAVSRTFTYMLPTIPVAIFRTREEAFSYLAAPLVREPRDSRTTFPIPPRRASNRPVAR